MIIKQIQSDEEIIKNLVYFWYANKLNHFYCKCLLVSLY